MNSVGVLTVTVLLLVGATLKVDGFTVTCDGVEIKMTEDHLKQMDACLKVVGLTKVVELGPNSAGCFSKCIFEQQNLVDGEGKPHKENIMKAMDILPPAVVESWKKTMGDCLDNQGSKIKNPDDANCSSYMPLTMCVATAIMTACTVKH